MATMKTTRVEAFSDGVLAIILTIMVLELKIPHDDSLQAILHLWPVLVSYLLSFLYVGIYWNNHHHLLHATQHITGGILWANLHLLFWLSLIPFVTGWMGENHFTAMPTAFYGFVLFMSAIAYTILQHTIIAAHGEKSLIRKALSHDLKGKMSPVLYAVAIASTCLQQWIAQAIYVGVALMWLIPDRRIEKPTHAAHKDSAT